MKTNRAQRELSLAAIDLDLVLDLDLEALGEVETTDEHG